MHAVVRRRSRWWHRSRGTRVHEPLVVSVVIHVVRHGGVVRVEVGVHVGATCHRGAKTPSAGAETPRLSGGIQRLNHVRHDPSQRETWARNSALLLFRLRGKFPVPGLDSLFLHGEWSVHLGKQNIRIHETTKCFTKRWLCVHLIASWYCSENFRKHSAEYIVWTKEDRSSRELEKAAYTNEELQNCSLNQILSRNQIKKDVTNGKGNTEDTRKVKLYSENLKSRDHLEDLGVDSKIILKCALKHRKAVDWIHVVQRSELLCIR
jgi:hypothetical protein